MPYVIRRILAPLAQFLFPVYGCCGRCRLPWKVVKSHDTPYHDGSRDVTVRIRRGQDRSDVQWAERPLGGGTSIFALCHSCWQELPTPEARLPYYRTVFQRWDHPVLASDESWQAIERAVLQGK